MECSAALPFFVGATIVLTIATVYLGCLVAYIVKNINR